MKRAPNKKSDRWIKINPYYNFDKVTSLEKGLHAIRMVEVLKILY